MDVIFVHGYNVTSTKTYGVLPSRLKSLGHRIKDVYLSKYVTLDNELTLADLIKALNEALRDVYGAKLESSKFACVTHSTGGLVVRGWVSTYYEDRMRACPISHLIMLAPPTHGSRLASVGKSRLSRLRSLWGVEPGFKILEGLDLGSRFQWNLDSRWMEKGTHLAPGFFPVVIAGQWIDKKLWDVIIPATYERGSDGVVRASSANLNMKKFVVEADGLIQSNEITGVPYLIIPKTCHSDERFGIMASVPNKGDHPVLQAIIETLAVSDRKGYQVLSSQFAQRTEDLQKRETYYDGTPLSRYCQLVIRMRDSFGNPVQDHAVELLDSQKRGDRFPTGFLPHNYHNPDAPETIIFYLDCDKISTVEGGAVWVRAQTVATSPLVAYDEGLFQGPLAKVDRFLAPNQTTCVEFVLRRRLNKKVFQLTKNLGYQKIDRKPGPDWID